MIGIIDVKLRLTVGSGIPMTSLRKVAISILGFIVESAVGRQLICVSKRVKKYESAHPCPHLAGGLLLLLCYGLADADIDITDICFKLWVAANSESAALISGSPFVIFIMGTFGPVVKLSY